MALQKGAVRHYTLSLADGNATNVGTALIAAGKLSYAEDGPYQQMIIYGGDSNSTRVVYVGGDNTVSSTDFGYALDAEESVTLSASLSANLRFREIWVIGTAADEVHFLVVVH